MIYSHTPFQAEYTSKIFRHIIASEKYLRFGLKGSEGTVAVIRGLLCPNPSFRLGNLSAGIKGIIEHPFFSDTDWSALAKRQTPAPYVPHIDSLADSSNFGAYEEETSIPYYDGSQEYFDSFWGEETWRESVVTQSDAIVFLIAVSTLLVSYVVLAATVLNSTEHSSAVQKRGEEVPDNLDSSRMTEPGPL